MKKNRGWKKLIHARRSARRNLRRKRQNRAYLSGERRLKEKVPVSAPNYKASGVVRRETIQLPSNFSFVNEPKLVLKAFAQFRIFAQQRRNVLIDFRAVKTMTHDVIPFLLAKVSKYGRVISIHSNRTSVPIIDDLLLESGFYKAVGVTDYQSNSGLTDTHKNKIVDTEIAQKARILTSTKTFGDSNIKIQALYRTIIECMANTNKHAYIDGPSQKWWLSVYYNPETRITSFAFCDTGVGIFKSANLEKWSKVAIKIGLTSNRSILQKILTGQISSSTGLPYRGKGLPKIFSDYKANKLQRLCIAANDTFADYNNGTFVDLKDELNGTFLYWEIWPN